jgi:hypothetical protein
VNVKFKKIVFKEDEKEYCFYEMTLPDSIEKMKIMGIDVIKNTKITISVYYY